MLNPKKVEKGERGQRTDEINRKQQSDTFKLNYIDNHIKYKLSKYSK